MDKGLLRGLPSLAFQSSVRPDAGTLGGETSPVRWIRSAYQKGEEDENVPAIRRYRRLVLAVTAATPGHEHGAPAAEESQKVVVHLSRFTDNLHAGFMAFKVANALQKHGAKVTVFLDLEGARLAHRHNNLAIRWGESDTTLGQLFDQFVKAGGKVVVCPHCAHHVEVTDANVREGIAIGTEEQIAKAMLEASKVIDY